MNYNYYFRVMLKLLIFLFVHLCIAVALLNLLGWTQFPSVLFLLMSSDELLLCGQPGKIIAKWIFDTEEVPALARVALLVIYLIVFFLDLTGIFFNHF